MAVCSYGIVKVTGLLCGDWLLEGSRAKIRMVMVLPGTRRTRLLTMFAPVRSQFAWWWRVQGSNWRPPVRVAIIGTHKVGLPPGLAVGGGQFTHVAIADRTGDASERGRGQHIVMRSAH